MQLSWDPAAAVLHAAPSSYLYIVTLFSVQQAGRGLRNSASTAEWQHGYISILCSQDIFK